MAFLRLPNGDYQHVNRIGGVRATDKGFMLLGMSENDLIGYVACPRPVAESWRDGVIDYLQSAQDRPGRRVANPDWSTLATNADARWAQANGYAGPLGPLGVPANSLARD